MNIEGKYTLLATPEEVWTSLMDKSTLERLLPGIQQLELLSSGVYSVKMNIGYSALVGSYKGLVTISEHQYPNSYHMHIEGEGRESQFEGSGEVHLEQQGDYTVIVYKGTLTVHKEGPHLSATIIKGAIKLFVQKFFTALSEQLHADRKERRETRTHTNPLLEVENSNGRIVLLPHAEEVTQELSIPASPLILRLVQKVGLGSGEPAQQLLWSKRIKQIGFASTLLLLVWVGSRLPRK